MAATTFVAAAGSISSTPIVIRPGNIATRVQVRSGWRVRRWRIARVSGRATTFAKSRSGKTPVLFGAAPEARIHDRADPALCVATVHANNTSRKVIGSCWHPQPSDRVHVLLGDDFYFYCRIGSSVPLVSCTMPTYNRRPFIQQALDLFQRQDYPRRELIVVDDGTDAVGELVAGVPDVHYVRVSSRTSIGEKRNLARQQAKGELIAHWDDDDWYSPDRLRYQVAPILAGKAEITGLDNGFVLELSSGEFRIINPQLHQRLFKWNVHGGTLVYRKDLLAQDLGYPNVNLGEDAYLLHYAMQRGKRLMRLANPAVFVCIRHGRNAWREFAPGHFLNPAGWERVGRPHMFPARMLAAYTSPSLVAR